eukprot:jgi/Botrbrau1/14471/Bobra.0014s0109.1
MKCCWDHEDAARAGHLHCLLQMRKAGQFLDLYSPERDRAGEARKAQAWVALLAACRADQPRVLQWLLSKGWPAVIDAAVVWHLRDIVQPVPLCTGTWETLDIPDMPEGDGIFLPEVQLYLYAIRNPTSACLEVLLRAGCWSEWLCPLAAKEGRREYLELAAKFGCPCDGRSLFVAAERGDLEVLRAVCLHADMPTCIRMMRKSVRKATEISVAKGHLSCFEALYHKYEECLNLFTLAQAAASKGQLECLQFITRLPEVTSSLERRPKGLAPAAAAAAQAGSLPCLKHLLELDPNLVSENLLGHAAASGNLDCLAFAHEAGFRSVACRPYWNLVVASGNPAVLAFVLDNVDEQGAGRDAAMEAAIKAGALECMRLLYARGYTVNRDRTGWQRHPVIVALRCGHVPCLQLAAEASRPPPAKEHLDCARAAVLGEATLRCVAALGGIMDYSTTAAAAGLGQLGALRFAHESGAPWDVGTLNAAVCGGWLDCLEYAHQHGCPYVAMGAGVEARVARRVQVLRYVCEHMDPAWAKEVVGATASAFAHAAVQGRWGDFDWELLLYLARRLGSAVPPPLAEMVAVRRERAAAFAGVFFKAAQVVESLQHWPGQLSRDIYREHVKRRCRGSYHMWEALARVPSELRERIAYEAHLIVL